MNNSIRKNFDKIEATEVRTGFGNTDICILKQKVTDIYPSATGRNSMTDSLFTPQDFGADGKQYSSVRATFIKVPKNSTKEQVQAKLDAMPEARLYRIMSMDYKNVMTDEQKRSVEEGFGSKSYEDYEESLRAKHPDTKENLLFDDKPFYRSVYFSTTPVEDVDLRADECNNFTVETRRQVVNVARPDEAEFAAHSGQRHTTEQSVF